MTRISFYFNADDALDLTRRLVGKAHQKGLYCLVYTDDAALAAQIDQHLWAAEPMSFVPHTLCEDAHASETPVLIGTLPDPLPRCDLLINLTPQPPACLARFDRMIEIVTRDSADREKARERYRHYQSRGYSLENHDLAATAKG